jgi:hypothetical protein
MSSMDENAEALSRISSLARNIACLCALAAIAVLGIGTPRAAALGSDPATENFIPQFSEYGTGASQTGTVTGMATNPTTGDIYMADVQYQRIEEFSPWGDFIKAFGWGVADGTSEQLQVCTTTCFAGHQGAGAGEFDSPGGIAVDSSGAVYVRDSSENRVQKFTSSGQFLLMFGGEVDKTQVQRREAQEAKAEVVTVTAAEENLCTAASGDHCGAGTEGQRPGQLSSATGLAIMPSGTLAVGDVNRIEEFNSDGTFASEVSLSGKVSALAVDPGTGDFYVTRDSNPEAANEGALVVPVASNVQRLSPTGVPLGVLEFAYPMALATDGAGDLYVAGFEQCSNRLCNSPQHLVEFSGQGTQIAEFDEVGLEEDGEPELEHYALATNAIGDLYVSSVKGSPRVGPPISFFSAYGPPPVTFGPPPIVPPTIASEYAVSVEQDHAVVKAQINPHFWNDTSFYVEYGLANCETNACMSQPSAPGSRLTAEVVAKPVTSDGVSLAGLQPDTTYHYRFVSEGGGGGPVYGADRTFTTSSQQVNDIGCPNQAFRIGPSAALPDCRAYEMVSPIEKDGGNIFTRLDFTDTPSGFDQSAAEGEKLAYSSYRSFGDAKGAPFTSQYLATRNPATGWATEALDPAQRSGSFSGGNFESPYREFSADLSSAWLALPAESVVAPGAAQRFRNLYRRDDESGGFEALTTVEPPTATAESFVPELQGATADGSHSIFVANDRLTADASSVPGIDQLYETDGSKGLRLVSMLPDGIASGRSASAGSVNSAVDPNGHFASVTHAISDDGTRVYWSEDPEGDAIPGKIYLRENADQEQSALTGTECTEPSEGCTVPVSPKGAQFWAASADGSSAIYTIAEGARKGELDEFNLEEGTSTPLAENVLGVLGASEDLSYVYFVSTAVLVHGAQAGRPNLYLYNEDTTDFIGTLSKTDTDYEDDKLVSDIENLPVAHVARVSPDGRHVAFISTAELTAYDNKDAASGESDSEVYIYDAESHTLDCVSCDGTGARPTGRKVQAIEAGGFLPTAAAIPPAQNALYFSRVLSDSGSRVFFDSYEGLVPADTNGKEDVYEWEAAGSGDCTAQSSAFSVLNGGCVALISSGVSPDDSAFVDASASGSDVFFATEASLVPQDPGSIDIYDARVDGGFPAPPAPPASCEGEACQSPAAPPIDATPASMSFSGPGNLVPALTTVATPTKTAVRAKRTVSQVKAAELTRALRTCRTKAKAKHRKSCEALARKRYGASAKRKPVKSNKGGK